MNIFNRIVLVILLLIAMVLCSLALVLPLPTLRAIELQAGALADLLSRIRPVALLPIGILLASIVDLIGVLLIILEVRRPKVRFIGVEKATGGEVQVSVASIVDRLKHEVDALPGVLKTKPDVSGKKGGVVIHLSVDIAAGLDVPIKAEQIVEATRQVVEEKMGLKMAKTPKVSLRTVPYPKAVRPKEKPPSPAEPAPKELLSLPDEEQG